MPALADAIAPFLASEEGPFLPQDGWRLLEVRGGDRAVIVHPGEGGRAGLLFMYAERTADGWEWSGASGPGSCDLVLEPPSGVSVVEWAIDPRAEPLGAESTTVAVLATESACASGEAMGDRLNVPVVTYTDDAVLLQLTAERRAGYQECPGNSSQRVEIELTERLGDRIVVDARTTDLGDLSEILQRLLATE